ncbi:hypothetical protein QR680_009091 [Steinernema hermaphroditum]|uniref:PDZ domain-containing protein n=1 Tax=Steinernema hermaphroditum TaxID=289476 RepID=A0AA39IKU3_9BILA|nr:hypothetical protein QR680_009091 [Steinernema hermaphroditum]
MATEGSPQGPASPSASSGGFLPNSDLLASALAQMPQAPPFFANPFMVANSTFAPPNGVTSPSAANVAFPQPNDAEFRANPFAAGGYFLSPGQYQEMMQQYMISWMAAAQQNKMNDSPMPFPFALPPFFGASPTPPSTAEKAKPSSRDPGAPPTLPQSSTSLTGSPSSGIRSSIQSSSTACSSPSLFASSKPSSCSPDIAAHEEDVEVAEADVAVDDEQEPQPSLEEAFKGISLKEEMSSVAEENAKEGDAGDDSAAWDAVEETPSTSALPEAEAKKSNLSEAATAPSTSTSSSASDCRTSVLIKKQMSEMDKEISRRMQNKHIKQIDESELEQLLNSSKSIYSTSTTAPGFGPDATQSALSYSTPTPTTSTTAPQKPTLNQLQASFSPPAPTTSSTSPVAPMTFVPFYSPQPATVGGASTVGFAPQAPTTASAFYPMLPQAQPQHGQPSITPEMAAVLLQQLQQNPTLLQNASRLLQQQTAQAEPDTAKAVADMLAMLPTMSVSASTPSSTTTASPSNAPSEGLPGALPPPPRNAGSQVPRNPKTTGAWAEENGWKELAERRHSSSSSTGRGDDKENAQEPVWVMRDSYLKRLQRDEERSQMAAEGPIEETDDASTSSPEKSAAMEDPELEETDKLLSRENSVGDGDRPKKSKKHNKEVLIEGVLFRARYLGSTQMICDGRPTKASRMMQAQEAVSRVKAPEGEIQPSTEIDLFISTEKIMVLNTDLQRISDTDVRQDILMDHALRTISYIADIGDVVVLMARRMSSSASEEDCSDGFETVRRTPRVVCHVFESEEASFIAQSIGQAFQVAYVEFLRANGIEDPSYLRDIDYQEVLNSQELMGEELEMFARKETQKDVVCPKKAGEALGVVVVESGWGSMLPTVVIANLAPGGPAARSNMLNIGDQIICINGISLVGLPLAAAQQNIKNARSSTAVKLTVVSTPPVVEVRIKRPDTKYQLGFSVQNGVICSLLRGGIAERGGIRVGHRIIEINNHSVVAVAHEKIVNMLATAIGEIHMKTMPTSMFRLLTGQEVPNYI